MSTRIVSYGPHLSSLEPTLRITILDCHLCKQLHSIVSFQNNSYFKKHSGLGILRFIQRDQMKPECFCIDKLPSGMRNFYCLSSLKKTHKKRPTGVEDVGKRSYRKPDPLFIHPIYYLWLSRKMEWKEESRYFFLLKFYLSYPFLHFIWK